MLTDPTRPFAPAIERLASAAPSAWRTRRHRRGERGAIGVASAAPSAWRTRRHRRGERGAIGVENAAPSAWRTRRHRRGERGAIGVENAAPSAWRTRRHRAANAAPSGGERGAIGRRTRRHRRGERGAIGVENAAPSGGERGVGPIEARRRWRRRALERSPGSDGWRRGSSSRVSSSRRACRSRADTCLPCSAGRPLARSRSTPARRDAP